MIDWLRRLFSRTDPVEDLVSAYVDADDEAERALIEDRLLAVGADLDEVKAIRATSRMLRGVATVEAPRSYALTAETLAQRGYSDAETERILNPRMGGIRTRLARPTVFVPLAIGALALIGVAVLTIGDITDYATERFDEDVHSPISVQGEARTLESAIEPGMPGEAGEPGELGLSGQPQGQGIPGLQRASDAVVTVVVEKEVQVAGETVVQTVVVETVIVEMEVVKEVEVERVVEVEREVVVEREVAEAPTPTPQPAMEMAKELDVDERSAEPGAMMSDAPALTAEGIEAQEEGDEAEIDDPCVVAPTATATTPGKSDELASPTPTASAVPTCTPTPTPTATSTATATPTPSP